MEDSTEKNPSISLTVENVELSHFIPYLLQDLWELGPSSKDVIYLLDKNISNFKNFKVLDLACGKGAVSIPLAKQFKTHITMVDIFPEFIQDALEKADEYNVKDLCTFRVEDINNTAKDENGKNWDCVLFCSVGDILGNKKDTIAKLKNLISPDGYIILHNAYLSDSISDDIKYEEKGYITYDEWLKIFDEEKIGIIDSFVSDKEEGREKNELMIDFLSNRVRELSEKHPELKELFESYLQSQIDGCYDMDVNLVCPIWLLKRK